jgi:hypothetical protein
MGWIAGFLDISLARANQFYTWGWRASVIGAVITMCGVGLLWLGTRVRDRDFDENIARLHDVQHPRRNVRARSKRKLQD